MNETLSIATLLAMLGFNAISRAEAATAEPVMLAATAPSCWDTSSALKGNVADTSGKPVRGAEVTAVSSLGPSRLEHWSASTDALGRFCLPARGQDVSVVRVRASGFASAKLATTGNAILSFILAIGRKTSGTVRDLRGRPIANAPVIDLDDSAGAWDIDAVGSRTKTDPNGYFELADVSGTPTAISVAARGYERLTQRVEPGTKAEFRLAEACLVRGVVVDSTSRPVAGAMIRAEPQGKHVLQPLVLSDSMGRFEIVGATCGPNLLVGLASDLRVAVQPITAASSGRPDVRMSLAEGAEIAGRLVDPNLRPVRGRIAPVAIDRLPVPASLSELFVTPGGTDGRFAIQHLPAGEWLLEASAPAYPARSVRVALELRTKRADLGNVVLGEGRSLLGHVMGPLGPVSGASITATPQDLSAGGAATSGASDASGLFTLAGLRELTYIVAVTASGFAPATKEVVPGEKVVDFVLSPSGGLQGIVSGSGIHEGGTFGVLATLVHSRAPTPIGRVHRSFSSRNGDFLIQGLAEGTYEVQILSPPSQPARLPTVEVEAGRITDLGNIALEPGAGLAGRVTNGLGDPIPGTRIRAVIGSTAALMHNLGMWQSVADADGQYTIQGLPIGRVTVVATHPDYQPERQAIDLQSPGETVDFRLQTGGRIEGVARRRDGTPFVAATVIAEVAEGSGYTDSRSATTASDGSFTIPSVAAGIVTVTLQASVAPGQLISVLSRTVEVSRDAVSRVELLARDVTVKGRLVRDGRGVPGVDLRLWSASGTTLIMSAAELDGPNLQVGGPQRLQATTGSDGSFVLKVDEPGRYAVQMKRGDGRGQYPSRAIEVPDTPSYLVEIMIPSVFVKGTVTDDDTEEPVPRARLTAIPSESAQGDAGPEAVADNNGVFDLSLDPGRYHLIARAPGYAILNSPLEVLDSPTDDIRLRLRQESAIVGRVLSGGVGVAGIQVIAVSEIDRRQMVTATTEQDGTFRVVGIGSGFYNLCAGDGDRGYAIAVHIEAASGSTTLALIPGGRIDLRVSSGQGGGPVRSATVDVVRAGSALIRVPITTLLVSDADGRVQIGSPAGPVEIEVTAASGTSRLQATVPSSGVVGLQAVLGQH